MWEQCRCIAGALVIDAGRDLGAEPGRVVLAGRRVWGKLATVGPHTSVVQRITDRGYRDTVQLARRDTGQLAHREGEQLRLGPRGVLVGSGDPLCQIELVEATEPVSVGDEVCTAADGACRLSSMGGSFASSARSAALIGKSGCSRPLPPTSRAKSPCFVWS